MIRLKPGALRLIQRIKEHPNVMMYNDDGATIKVRTRCGLTIRRSVGFGRHTALNSIHERLTNAY
jgi:hypothetical protein